jgi:CRISPR-associated protein Cmr3
VLIIGEKTHSLHLERRNENTFISSNTECEYFLFAKQVGKAEATTGNYFLTSSGAEKYLKGDAITERDYISLTAQELMKPEAKVGIGRNEQMTTEEGKLFRFARKRLNKGLGFYVAFDHLKIPPNGLLALGSDGVSASYQTVEAQALPECTLVWSVETVYKLWFCSPAIFKDDKPYIPPILQQAGIELLTYAMNRPVGIGGWDMKRNAPKPLVQSVPSGTVYYFKVSDEEIFKQIKALHGKSFCQNEFQKQGFGIALLGIHQDKNTK